MRIGGVQLAGVVDNREDWRGIGEAGRLSWSASMSKSARDCGAVKWGSAPFASSSLHQLGFYAHK